MANGYASRIRYADQNICISSLMALIRRLNAQVCEGKTGSWSCNPEQGAVQFPARSLIVRLVENLTTYELYGIAMCPSSPKWVRKVIIFHFFYNFRTAGLLSSSCTNSLWRFIPVFWKICLRCVRAVFCVTPNSVAATTMFLPCARIVASLVSAGVKSYSCCKFWADGSARASGSVMKIMAADCW